MSAPREENRIRADTPVFESNGKMKQKRDGIVYFNSNRYLGFSPGDERSSSSGESIVEKEVAREARSRSIDYAS